MLKYTIKRILQSFPIALAVCSFCFFLIHFIPGDPIDIILGEQATPLERTALAAELNLDKPLIQQYTDYLLNLSTLNLGTSIQSKRPVFEELTERLPATVELTLAAMFIAIFIGITSGVICAIFKGKWIDKILFSYSLLAMSLPSFWLGPMLILIFSIRLDLLPVSDRGTIYHLILPALSLAIPLSTIILRMTRTSMLEVINEDYIRSAKAKGCSSFQIYFKHALRNALMPIITIVGLQFGALLTGTVITETIFDWPGVGSLFFQSIQERNYPLIQACVLFVALCYVYVNLATDLMYAAANPKVRLTQ